MRFAVEYLMLPRTNIEPRDDPAFLAVVDRLVGALVRRDMPEEVYLIHIDNWFDEKWLRYSGYGAVGFAGGYPRIESAKKEHRQDQLTFPPFTPNRVVAQYMFCRVGEGLYEERAPALLIHRRERARSAKNLHRRVADFSRSGLFVWYSSNSSANRRASLLVYKVCEDAVSAWYAGFSERQGWQLDQVKWIGRDMVTFLTAEEITVQKADQPTATPDCSDM